MQMRDVGEHAVLVEVADASQAVDLAAWLRSVLESSGLTVDEIVPAARTVLVDGLVEGLVDGVVDGRVGRADLASLLDGWTPSLGPAVGRLVELPVVYDGADLDRVAQCWSTDPPGVARLLSELDLVVAFCGFAPGFAYLAGLPEELAVPRLESPRPRVPAKSLAVADTWCAAYPSASPGGWSLLGRTSASLWDQARPEPALLSPGTRVRLRTVEVAR